MRTPCLIHYHSSPCVSTLRLVCPVALYSYSGHNEHHCLLLVVCSFSAELPLCCRAFDLRLVAAVGKENIKRSRIARDTGLRGGVWVKKCERLTDRMNGQKGQNQPVDFFFTLSSSAVLHHVPLLLHPFLYN
ncbi:hypothetical protein AMECASPLE_003867 [Ameca splendens]|uniref:Uncharacterized protein n=1 Tax=Ameca splendens TaxID=208324 RepID=A0ABV0Z7U2_9TELE